MSKSLRGWQSGWGSPMWMHAAIPWETMPSPPFSTVCCRTAAVKPWQATTLRWCNADFHQLYRILQHCRLQRQQHHPQTAATFCVPAWMDRPWWRMLKGMHVAAMYPAGEQLFTAPDWHSLERKDGRLGLGGERQSAGGTTWPVLIVYSPPPCRQGAHSSSRVRGAGAFNMHSRRALPALSGDAQRDAALLLRVQALPLQRVQPSGPRAHRPCHHLHPVSFEGAKRT